MTLPLPTTSAVSSASLPHQIGPPSLSEAIRNAPRRRQQPEPSQIIPEGFTLYSGAGENERQAINQRLTIQQQRPDQARDIPPRVLIQVEVFTKVYIN